MASFPTEGPQISPKPDRGVGSQLVHRLLPAVTEGPGIEPLGASSQVPHTRLLLGREIAVIVDELENRSATD